MQKTGDKLEKSCGAVVRRRGDDGIRYFLIHQTRGHWGFPKGHVEGTETERETAAREIREETGYAVTFVDGFRRELAYRPKPGVWKTVVYFLADCAGGTERLQAEEVSDGRWCSAAEAETLITFENDRKLLRAAEAFAAAHPER